MDAKISYTPGCQIRKRANHTPPFLGEKKIVYKLTYICLLHTGELSQIYVTTRYGLWKILAILRECYPNPYSLTPSENDFFEILSSLTSHLPFPAFSLHLLLIHWALSMSGDIGVVGAGVTGPPIPPVKCSSNVSHWKPLNKGGHWHW